jgi:hypothetical protein
MEFIGRQIYFGIAAESVRGTAEAAATRWLRKTTCDIIPRSERVTDDTSFGRLEDADRVRTVRKWNEGSLEGIVHADVLGYFLLNLYGDVESTVVTGSIYDHVFELDQTIQHPTLTLFVKDGAVRDVKMAGGVISSFELSASTDDYLRYTANFIGKQEAAATSSPSTETEYDFVPRDIEIKLADAEAGLSGATATKAKEMTITWNPNAIVDYTFGSYSPDDIYNGAFSIEISLTRNYTEIGRAHV